MSLSNEISTPSLDQVLASLEQVDISGNRSGEEKRVFDQNSVENEGEKEVVPEGTPIVNESGSGIDIISSILGQIKKGRNVFIAGPGGCGKSHMLREVYSHLVAQGVTVAMTATTGVAAVSVGGTTLHSWSGIRLGDKSPEYHYEEIKRNWKNVLKWKKTSVLLIDEVSMLGRDLFDKLDYIARKIRGKDLPFGGITLVFCGDMCQLPPVQDFFVFMSKIWHDLDFEYYKLKKPWRFMSDIEFFYLLQRMRGECLTRDDYAKLDERKVAYINLQKNLANMPIKPTRLYARKLDVDALNAKELAALPHQAYQYLAHDLLKPKGKANPNIEVYQRIMNASIPVSIVLKQGAQVILTANIDVEGGLCNGSRGVVIECMRDVIAVLFKNGRVANIPAYTWKLENDEGIFQRNIMPFILGWSYTIHKAQGQTLDSAIIDIREVFCDNQAYVALSRCRNLDSMYLVDYSPDKMKMDPLSTAFEAETDTRDVISLMEKGILASLGPSEDNQRIIKIES